MYDLRKNYITTQKLTECIKGTNPKRFEFLHKIYLNDIDIDVNKCVPNDFNVYITNKVM